MSAWEEWCSIRVEDEFIAFPRLQELHLDVLLKYPRSAQSFVTSAKFIKFLKAEFHAILQASSSHKIEAFTTFHLMIIP